MTQPPPIDASRNALFLDFDGTLVDFHDDPAAISVDRKLVDVLSDLMSSLSGAMAVVSGRKIDDIDRFLTPLEVPAAGVHGLERRSRPGVPIDSLAGQETLDDVRDALSEVLEINQRLTLEDKGTALVLHYRTAPDLQDVAEAAAARAVRDRDDLVLMEGNHIVEIHPAGMDKGQAVAALMTEAPFAGRIPIYVGDDTTDEFALETVQTMGGVSIKVGEKESVAEFRLDNVAAVHRWLATFR